MAQLQRLYFSNHTNLSQSIPGNTVYWKQGIGDGCFQNWVKKYLIQQQTVSFMPFSFLIVLAQKKCRCASSNSSFNVIDFWSDPQWDFTWSKSFLQMTVPLGSIPFSTLHQICSIQMYFKYSHSFVLCPYSIKYRWNLSIFSKMYFWKLFICMSDSKIYALWSVSKFTNKWMYVFV